MELSRPLITEKNITQRKINIELVDLLYKQVPLTLMAENLAALIITITFWGAVSKPLLLGWYLSNSLFSGLARSILVYFYQKRANYARHTNFWLYSFMLGSSLSGLSWGLAGLFLMPLYNVPLQSFIIIFLFGVCAASNTIFSPIKMVYTVFLLLVMFPVTILLFLHPTGLNFFMASGALIFVGVMLVTSHHAHNLIRNTYRLRFENAELIGAKKQLEHLNQDLYFEIKQRKNTEKMLDYLAKHDSLTKLPNRAFFHSKLQQAIEQAKINHSLIAVFFLDMDNFKKINDTMGHDVGDQLLCMVSERLKSVVKANLLARMGGDEFTIILEQVSSKHEALKIAEKICESFSEPFYIKHYDLYVTVSIGVSFYPNDAQDIQTLIKNSDIALYHAKACGKATCKLFTIELDAALSRKHILEIQLRKAFELNQFQLYYQPIIDAKTKQIVAAEALIRWQHPELGLVTPIHFIDLMEENGMIYHLDDWVLYQACLQNKQWQDAGLSGLQISVNVSSKQFLEKNLVDKVSNILENLSLPGCYLNLEITENLLMQDFNLAIQLIAKLKDLGVQISIDDFGIGYSSLAYLKRLPVDKVKIDQMFVKGIPDTHDDLVITSSIINLAHNLGLQVVAEGVENTKQLHFMQQNNCDMVQGYLLGHPMPVQEFATFFAKQLH